MILLRRDGEIIELARAPYPFEIDESYDLCFSMKGKKLSFAVDGKTVVEAEDGSYTYGGAGFIVETGAMLADGFTIESLEDCQ